jgi:hypothetical protein
MMNEATAWWRRSSLPPQGGGGGEPFPLLALDALRIVGAV